MKKVRLFASEEMCDILWNMLDAKYTTLRCSSPAACEELLCQNPDALIIDLFLTGYDSMAFLREHSSSLPSATVALTAYFDYNLLQELLTLGITSVIRIPFRPEYLIQQLSDLL